LKYAFPANFAKAKLHRIAVKFGYNPKRTQKKTIKSKNLIVDELSDDNKKKLDKPKLCPCCNLPVNTQNIPI
jgi:hypothetical protein